jgi:uncharacterized protein
VGADPRAPARPRLPIRGALGFYGVLLGAAVLWRSVLLGEPLLFASEEAARAGLHPLRDLALGAACGLAASAASGLAERRTAWGRRLAAELAGLVGPVSRAEAAALALASGVAEEAFFRGALQPSVGLVAASALFALVHVPASRGLRPWPVLALAAGLGLGLLFEATGSLVAPARPTCS